jgi:hypothetical protein
MAFRKALPNNLPFFGSYYPETQVRSKGSTRPQTTRRAESRPKDPSKGSQAPPFEFLGAGSVIPPTEDSFRVARQVRQTPTGPVLGSQGELIPPEQAWMHVFPGSRFVRSLTDAITSGDSILDTSEFFMPDEKAADTKTEKRQLGNQRQQLTDHGKELARQVVSKKLNADAALDLFYARAGSLTANEGDALLVAAGSALDLRRTMMDVNGKKRIVGTVLTEGSLGPDSLHHFAFAASNAYDNWLIPAQTVGNIANWAEDPADPDSQPDIVANSAGADFGQRVFWKGFGSPKPSASLSAGRKELYFLQTHKEYKPAVIK